MQNIPNLRVFIGAIKSPLLLIKIINPMFNHKILRIILFPILFAHLLVAQDQLKTKIAFGSCGHQDEKQPILARAAQQKPDFFIFLGDNIYGDTYDMEVLKAKYQKLGNKPEFKALQAATTLLATWDDHDFGWNDSGRHYPHKEASKEIFLDFFKEPAHSDRRQHPGIYDSKIYTYGTKTLQIILLDTRTFRDDLSPYDGRMDNDPKFPYQLDYAPTQTADSTLLGATQWAWLAQQLAVPADVRIIASSTQFGISYNGYEAWANFPAEREKMLQFIRDKKANGIIFISGDVHYAEISKLEAPKLYPIYDITASGITSTWDFATPNDHRVDGPYMKNHFGVIEIDWLPKDPIINFRIIDKKNKERFSRQIRLSEISFP